MFRSYSENICRPGINRTKMPVNQSFKCDTCDESTWLSETDVELHRKEAHWTEIQYEMINSKDRFCKICMRVQENKAALIRHIKTRHLLSSPQARRIEREIFICTHCHRIFFNKDILQSHMELFHKYPSKYRKNRKTCCPKCKKICKLQSFWFHMNGRHELPSVSSCDICITNLPSVKDLMKHWKLHPYHYKCDICGYLTSKDVCFEAHLDMHSAVKFKFKTVDKEVINAVFSRCCNFPVIKYNIHNTMKGLHLQAPMMICVLCREICNGIVEAQTHLLRDHMQVTQSNIKNKFVCSCGEEFYNRVLIKHHLFKNKGHRELNESEISKKITEITINNKDYEQAKLFLLSEDPLEDNPSEDISPEDIISEDIITEEIISEDIPSEDMPIVIEVTSDQVISEEPQYIISDRSEISSDEVGQKGSANQNELTYVLAEIEVNDDEMVTVNGETNEQVIGFS